MGKAFRNPKLSFIVCREMHAHPLTEGRGVSADVDSNIEDFAGCAAY